MYSRQAKVLVASILANRYSTCKYWQNTYQIRTNTCKHIPNTYTFLRFQNLHNTFSIFILQVVACICMYNCRVLVKCMHLRTRVVFLCICMYMYVCVHIMCMCFLHSLYMLLTNTYIVKHSLYKCMYLYVMTKYIQIRQQSFKDEQILTTWFTDGLAGSSRRRAGCSWRRCSHSCDGWCSSVKRRSAICGGGGSVGGGGCAAAESAAVGCCGCKFLAGALIQPSSQTWIFW